MGKSWLGSRRRVRRPHLPLLVSTATFFVYRTTVNIVVWSKTWQVWPTGRNGRAWHYPESSARITVVIPTINSRYER